MTLLRQWCPACAEATISRICAYCHDTICAECEAIQVDGVTACINCFPPESD
jgi:hypothetical protein